MGETSFETCFRGLDLHQFQRHFPDLMARHLRGTGLTARELGFRFNVHERTAQNWLDGLNRPAPDKVAVMVVCDETFAAVVKAALRGRVA
ncbi:hypothetical protein PVW47_01500 [Marinovum sp. SP66]|uniref:hypothetical protein n=1 Tax=Marinovum TaxID=367771 RepID=UPI00237BF3ED|nr:hypothetical protein [Marinovum sp. SP66]MDD9738448.1 hypothetical protein [Marinovum sp. SP66]